jgi:hypothetical protein
MASYDSTSLKFFESGFLTVGTGKVVLGLTDISLDYTVDSEEYLTYDFNRSKKFYPTFSSWKASASGKFLAISGDTYSPQSGDTRVVTSHNGASLLEQITLKGDLPIVFKLDASNYQVSTAILTSYSVSSSAGSALEFTIELQGTSDLTKQTS